MGTRPGSYKIPLKQNSNREIQVDVKKAFTNEQRGAVIKAIQKAFALGRAERQIEEYEKGFALGQASMQKRFVLDPDNVEHFGTE
jgi:hypothetical protein